MRKIFLGLSLLGVLILFFVFLLYLYNVIRVERLTAEESAPSSTKFLKISEKEIIAYSEVNNNSSTTVIFIGGLSAWNGTWERTISALNDSSKSFNYIALDLPPFGYSLSNPNQNYFRSTQARRVADFIEMKKLSRVIIVAHSYGAGPGTEYVMTSDKVSRLVIIDGVLNIDETKVVSKYSPVQLSPLRSLALGVMVHYDKFAISRLKSFVAKTEHINQDLLDIYTRYFDTDKTTTRLSNWLSDYTNDPLLYSSNESANYKKLTIPVRLIWGTEDTITPISSAEIILASVPDVSIARLSGVGHIPMIEDFEQFDSALLLSLTK